MSKIAKLYKKQNMENKNAVDNAIMRFRTQDTAIQAAWSAKLIDAFVHTKDRKGLMDKWSEYLSRQRAMAE